MHSAHKIGRIDWAFLTSISLSIFEKSNDVNKLSRIRPKFGRISNTNDMIFFLTPISYRLLCVALTKIAYFLSLVKESFMKQIFSKLNPLRL